MLTWMTFVVFILHLALALRGGNPERLALRVEQLHLAVGRGLQQGLIGLGGSRMWLNLTVHTAFWIHYLLVA